MKFISTIVLALALASSGSVLADAAAGKSAYAAKGCIGCHGAGGKSMVATYPSLAGRDAAFVKKNLTDFRSGARENPVMKAMAGPLSDADIDNLSAYIDTLK
ncbi:MAG: cytochrome c [Gammaproteobacteria bacterium]|nr:cytochrome c [Gammaproteobacteria bacterium]